VTEKEECRLMGYLVVLLHAGIVSARVQDKVTMVLYRNAK
jgi:hypothetical protein